MAFDKRVAGCFGVADLIFAGHPLDEGRAFEWLTSLRERNIGFADATEQVREFLKSKGANDDHISKQIERMTPYMKPWLLD